MRPSKKNVISGKKDKKPKNSDRMIYEMKLTLSPGCYDDITTSKMIESLFFKFRNKRCAKKTQKKRKSNKKGQFFQCFSDLYCKL